MLHYIIQVVAFQLLFLGVYDLCLRKDTFFNLNRAYLLSTALLSLVIPFIKIAGIKAVVAKDFVISLPEVFIGESLQTTTGIQPELAMATGINLEIPSTSIWSIILISGMCIATLILAYKVFTLVVLASKSPKRRKGKVLIVSLLNSTSAFSFFNYIFLGNQLSDKDSTSILEHEMVHINQRHSLDLLFFELLRIVFWFNPLVYLYQSRVATLHEYIADAKAVKGQNKADYYDNLLTQVFETQQFSFVNPFFKHSLIKKRILMLSKSKSNQINLIKYAVLIPLVFVMLVYTSSYAQEKAITSSSEIENQDTQELTDEALKLKLYEEIVALDKSGKTFMEITDFVIGKNEGYIVSRTQYYRLDAFKKYLSDKAVKPKTREGQDTQVLSKSKKTYKEYLEWKRTPEAKQNWMSNDNDGVLRLFVEDLSNLTSEENKQQVDKLDKLKTNDIYNTLVVADFKEYRVYDLGKEQNTSGIYHKEDIEIIEVEETAEVPFSIIEETPTFTFCEALKTNRERKQCMSDNIAKHVNKNFNTKLADSLGLVGRQRIHVVFKIDKEGRVKDVRSRAAHPALEEEAERIIKTLPQFIPGKQKGKAVVVAYSLPILFQVASTTNQDKKN